MSDNESKTRVVQLIAFACVIVLFTADYVFGAMAKEPPMWAYFVPGLLALGIEARAVGRLLMQIVRGLDNKSQQGGDDQ